MRPEYRPHTCNSFASAFSRIEHPDRWQQRRKLTDVPAEKRLVDPRGGCAALRVKAPDWRRPRWLHLEALEQGVEIGEPEGGFRRGSEAVAPSIAKTHVAREASGCVAVRARDVLRLGRKACSRCRADWNRRPLAQEGECVVLDADVLSWPSRGPIARGLDNMACDPGSCGRLCSFRQPSGGALRCTVATPAAIGAVKQANGRRHRTVAARVAVTV
mmetsp:Transcript_63957/g.190902  ORF Transcript_63957/g.190902 Transcript_63957/m.190902 type:complete len:216 (-) Transcript_63957:113-760(-)